MQANLLLTLKHRSIKYNAAKENRARLEQFGSGENQLKKDNYRISWPNDKENMFLFVFGAPLRGRDPECLE